MFIENGMKILFIGDSLTDAGASYNSPDEMGNGYPRYIRDYIYAKYPALDLTFYNKGVSGNRTSDLLNRWEKDVLSFSPDLLSICIGTNDIWRQFDSPELDIIDVDKYEDNLRKMITLAKENCNSKILLFEIPPVELGFNNYECSSILETKGNLLINEYNKRVFKLAAEFNTLYCPLNKIFLYNMNKNKKTKYTNDGIHPTTPGIMTYALSFLSTLNL